MRKVVSIMLMVVFLLVIGVSAVSAAGAFDQAKTNLQTGGEKAYGEGTESSLSKVVGNIVNGILVISGIILTVIILRGGFMYMTAGGDSGKVDKAKDWIRNGIIGLVIVLMAYSISAYVMNWLILSVT